ncbi:MAG: alanine racemase [Acidimicrobiales bacterium]
MQVGVTVAELRIDLTALQANWQRFRALAPRSTVASMVKADAYGLGVRHVAPALAEVGCREFFVAEPAEGIALRNLLPDVDIHVLAGVGPGAEATFDEYRLVPVLISLEQVERWSRHARSDGHSRAGTLHIDTGMNRTGLDANETASIVNDPSILDGIELVTVMSHLACAEDPSHELNRRQRERFVQLRKQFPTGRASLANSGGIGLGPDYHFDLVRPGIGLYGVDPTPDGRLVVSPVVTLTAPVLQIRTAAAGDTVGYGATRRLVGERRLATLAVGYGDGYHRAASDVGWVAFGGHRAPIVGRVSMDLLTVDITDLPADVRVETGTMAELIGETLTIHEVASAAGTIAYEVLTNLGQRYARSYTR